MKQETLGAYSIKKRSIEKSSISYIQIVFLRFVGREDLKNIMQSFKWICSRIKYKNKLLWLDKDSMKCNRHIKEAAMQ